MMNEPLSAWRAVATADVDEAADHVGRIFCPHRLEPHGDRRRFRARHNHRRLGPAGAPVSVNYVAYGGEVTIDPGCLGRFFLLQMPVAGGATVRTGGRVVETAAGRAASLLSPTEATTMRWSDCAQLILFVERGHLERTAAAMLGKGERPVVLPPSLATAGGIGAAVARQLAELAHLGGTLREGAAEARALDEMARGVAALLVAAVAGGGREATASARTADRAVALAEERLDEAIDYAALAADCGVSPRALQMAVRRRHGRTLSEIVRERRLERLRARLADPAETRTVAALMLDCGLPHLGRAAAAYRARFGETPAETRRRR